MLKTTLVLVALAATAVTVETARTIYTRQAPVWGSIKVTPNPANIWSWNETVPVANGSVQVLVDINGDGIMDTVDPHLTVMITDAQIWRQGFYGGPMTAVIRDSSGSRWRLATTPSAENSDNPNCEVHFSTPLTLPVGSDLWVDYEFHSSSGLLNIHLIGRVVNR